MQGKNKYSLPINFGRMLDLSLLLLLLLIGTAGFGQDLEIKKNNSKKDKSVKLSGGLQTNIITNTGDAQLYRLPLAWNVNGNINLNLFDKIDLPISLNLSNLNQDLQVPNTPTRISLSPKYKAITTHIGDLNLSYSPYTLNGHQFVGGGLDIAPEKSRLSIRAMGGKFQRAIEYDSINSNYIAAFERWGYGGKVQYKADDYHIGLNVFTATDREQSLLVPAEFIGVRPQQNLVGSLEGSLRPFKGMEVRAEVAVSALTSDIRDTAETVERSGVLNPFFTENNSTGYYNAQKIEINYNAGRNRIGLSYEKIDPEYRTLGAYFFTNDLENITLNLGRSLFNNKLSFYGRGGLQRDNIDNTKPGQNKRIVGSVNLNYNPSNRLQLSGNYSNFTTIMRVQSQFQFINQANQFQSLDTFNFSQVSQNLNVSSNYRLSEKDSSMQFLNLYFSLQDINAQQFGQELIESASVFYNLGVSHIFQQMRLKFDVVTSYYATSNQMGGTQFFTHGPSVAFSKSLAKEKIRLLTSVNYNISNSRDLIAVDKAVLNLRFGVNYRLNNKNSLMASLQTQTIGGVNSQLGNISYGFIF
jgi:hypothetical protein